MSLTMEKAVKRKRELEKRYAETGDLRLIEVDYFKKAGRGIASRRQLLETLEGRWEISNAYPVEREGSLRGLCGGRPGPEPFAERADAERWLDRASWFRDGETSLSNRNQTRAEKLARTGKVAVEVWITPEQRDLLRRMCAESKFKQSELFAKWLDRQAIFSPIRK